MSVEEEHRAALFAIADLWATYVEDAHESLAYSFEDSDSNRFSIEGALIDALRGDCIVYCDWRSAPPEIRSYLERLPAVPSELSWEWFDWTKDEDWDPDDLDKFVQPLADRCSVLNTVVVGIEIYGDGFTLGFLPADKLDRLLRLAATAEVSIKVHHASAPTA